MRFKAIKVPKISESIVNQLEEMILDGAVKPGERLPPERELAQQLGVSRPSLREAIVILESKGLLQARRGGGTYVCDVVAHTITDPLVHLLRLRPETTFDVLELRIALEEMAAFHAASRSNEVDREIIRRRFEALEASYDDYHHLQNAEADVEFHMSIADASHNVALVHVMRGLFELLHSRVTDNLEKMLAEPESVKIVLGQHRRMHLAIMQGDPEQARAAAHAHLAFVITALRKLSEESTREKRSRSRLQNIED